MIATLELTPTQAAELLGVHPVTVYHAMTESRPLPKAAERCLRILVAAKLTPREIAMAMALLADVGDVEAAHQ